MKKWISCFWVILMLAGMLCFVNDIENEEGNAVQNVMKICRKNMRTGEISIEEIPVLCDENTLDLDNAQADILENGTYRYEYDTRIIEVGESSILVEDSNYKELTVYFDSINETFAAGDLVTIETDGLVREMIPPWTKGISIKKKIE